MEKGVEVIFLPKIRVPSWVRNQNLNVKIKKIQLNGRQVRSLEICNGEASFLPGGSVSVRMPGSDRFWVAFQPMTVIEIRDLEGNVIEHNRYSCQSCGRFTVQVDSSSKSSESAGRLDANFSCICGNQWELKGI